MTDVTLVLIRIFLKILWFDRVAEFVSDLPDLAEPDFLIVLVVVGREILLDDRRHIAGGFLWEVVFNLKQIVEEIADVLDDLLRVDVVFTRVALLVTADVENFFQIGAVFENMQKFRLEFLRPRLEEVEQVGSADLEQHVLADVVQFVQIEQGAGVTHLLSRKGEIIDWRVRIGDAPFLKVRVEDGQQLFADRGRMIALVAVVI